MYDNGEPSGPEWLEKLHMIQRREDNWATRLRYLDGVVESLKELGDAVLGFNCYERHAFPDGFHSFAPEKDATMSIPVKASAVLPWAEAYLAEQKEIARRRPDVLAKVKELAESIE